MLHFVELKADFFRLRRRFLREEALRMHLEREAELRNRTLASAQDSANSSLNNGSNGYGVNRPLHQSYGTEGTQSYVNYGNDGNNRDYRQHYSDDKLFVQSSESYPSQQLPPNLYLQPKRLLRRRLVSQQLRTTNINSRIPHNIRPQRLQSRGHPQRVAQRVAQRVVPIYRRQQPFRRRVGKNRNF